MHTSGDRVVFVVVVVVVVLDLQMMTVADDQLSYFVALYSNGGSRERVERGGRIVGECRVQKATYPE